VPDLQLADEGFLMLQVHVRVQAVLRQPLKHVVRRRQGRCRGLLDGVLIRHHGLLDYPLQLIILHLTETISVEVVLEVLLDLLLPLDGPLYAVQEVPILDGGPLAADLHQVLQHLVHFLHVIFRSHAQRRRLRLAWRVASAATLDIGDLISEARGLGSSTLPRGGGGVRNLLCRLHF
jgi:hypothetical protein